LKKDVRERVTDALLSPAELERRCADFKEEWYAVARQIDAIAEFSSGEQPAFRRTLAEINKNLEHLLTELDVLARSAKRHMPEIRAEVDHRTAGIEQGLKDLASKVKEELEKLEKFIAIKREVSALREEIGKINKEFKEVDARVATLCTRFFERQRELKLAKEKIKARVEKGLYDLQAKFEEKATGIVGDYELYYAGEPTTPEQLFKAMLRDPSAIEKVYLREARPSRSFLGIRLKREGLGEEARLEVLRYIAQELIEEARRIKEVEMENARNLSREFADLDSLEKACRDVEKRREELENYRNELEDKIAQFEERINRNFDDYNEILSIKEEFTSVFDSIDPEIRGFLEYIAATFGDLEIEHDPEKRRLLSRIGELEKEMQKLASQLESLKEEREALKEKVSRYARELEDRNSIIASLKDKNSELERKLSELEKEYEEFRRRESEKAEILKEENLRLAGEVENLRAELEKFTNASEKLEDEKAKLEKELEEEKSRVKALEEEIARLRAEVERSLLDILEKIRS
jgi:chromosome segregation ATPase